MLNILGKSFGRSVFVSVLITALPHLAQANPLIAFGSATCVNSFNGPIMEISVSHLTSGSNDALIAGTGSLQACQAVVASVSQKLAKVKNQREQVAVCSGRNADVVSIEIGGGGSVRMRASDQYTFANEAECFQFIARING